MNQKSKIKNQKSPAPAWHAEAAALLNKNFSEIDALFMSAADKAVWLGIYLNKIKQRGKEDGSIPHSRFGPWLGNHLPSAKLRTLSRYITIGKYLLEKAGVKNAKIAFLDIEDGSIPAPVKEIMAGKNQNELFLEWKQSKPSRTDELVLDPARGRRPGEGGKDAEPADPLANAEYHRAYSLRHMGKIDHELEKMGLRCLHCPDDQLTAFLGSLERTAKVLNQWLNTPRDQRDPAACEKLWRKL